METTLDDDIIDDVLLRYLNPKQAAVVRIAILAMSECGVDYVLMVGAGEVRAGTLLSNMSTDAAARMLKSGLNVALTSDPTHVTLVGEETVQ
jgi:hypothetical protein